MKKTSPFILLMLINFVLVSVCLSCKGVNKSKFDRFDELEDFLVQELKMNLSGRLIVIIVTGSCNPCEEETIKLMYDIEKEKKLSNYKRIVIVPYDRKDLSNNLKLPNFRIFYDREMKLLSYGLNFHDNVIMAFSHDHEEFYFSPIRFDNIGLIRSNVLPR